MDIDNIIKNLKNDNKTNAVKRTEFVEFMEKAADPYIVLICCILSLRTNDKTTYPAAMRMLELGKTPQEIMNIEYEKLRNVHVQLIVGGDDNDTKILRNKVLSISIGYLF